MNSARSSTLSNSKVVQVPKKRSPSSKATCIQNARQRATRKIANKYSTCQNYMILSEINRTIIEKQCILKTTVKDISFDRQEEKIQVYYPISRTNDELPELIEYYKYYSQKSILFDKDFFPLLYQYQEKRKFIEYNRLKVLLNLSNTQKPQNSSNVNKSPDLPSVLANRSRIGISRNLLNNDDGGRYKDIQCSNILDDLSLSNFSTTNDNEESLLINRLRNNLSKHIGPSHIKNMSIEELDKYFDFQNKKNNFRPFKENTSQINSANQKNKLYPSKPKKVQLLKTATNTPQQPKQKRVIRRSAKRNNSCKNLIRNSVSKTPYEPATCKIKRKKNLSMENLCTNTSTPYMLEERRQTIKLKKVPSMGGDRYQKQKENALASKGAQKFADTISELKNKIQKEKQTLVKASSGAGFTSLKREKNCYTSINTANQKFSKKNYDKLREKTLLGN